MLRSVARALLPAGARRGLRIAARELPHRTRDLPADLLDLWPGGEPLPPASLRRRVALTSSRAEFVEIGRRLAECVATFVAEEAGTAAATGRWLDFGCGCGRVARHLTRDPRVEELAGVDVDRAAVAWCRRHLAGSFDVVDDRPPTPLEGSRFQVVVAISVFSHLDERQGLEWLEELRRLLAPGGSLVASTHSPELLVTRPDLGPEAREELERAGFLFAPGPDRFNDHGAFHSREYLERRWSRVLDPVAHRDRGLLGYQDLSLWRRP